MGVVGRLVERASPRNAGLEGVAAGARAKYEPCSFPFSDAGIRISGAFGCSPSTPALYRYVAKSTTVVPARYCIALVTVRGSQAISVTYEWGNFKVEEEDAGKKAQQNGDARGKALCNVVGELDHKRHQHSAGGLQ